MPDGDSPRLSGVGDGGDGAESSTRAQTTEKDPRKIARKYQLDLCKKAMEENIIVYLGTGCGKTHIAVLLINELGYLIRKPQKNICVFLAPTVALVHQQARVIEESLDFKVGTFCGSSKPLKNHHDWEKEIDQYEVLVMIPEILLMSLYHRSIKMELIALLIFDECHHAQINSNHSYAQIMKDFYKPDTMKVPRIFGMTASPVVGKGASNQANLPKSINSLESILDAKVCSVDMRDLKYFVASPVMRVYQYGPVSNSTSSTFMTYSKKLAEIRRECISAISRETNDNQSLRNTKKQLNRLHENMIFCLENLGLWGALQASQILLSGDRTERSVLIEVEGNSFDDSLCRFVVQAVELFAADCTRDGFAPDLSSVEDLKEPFFSEKILCLIGILSTFRLQPNMKCIIFVNRIITARSLSYILQKLKFLASWKCHFLVGVHAGLKSMSRKTMKNILEKFRSGELNLLVATKVGEEGLDIQTCCLVIRFDLPETVSSFIQSRGRARMPQSEYAFLVDSGNQKELDLIEIFRRDENRMNMEIATRTSNETFIATEERLYTVDSSGACSSAGYSISLLHRYCSKLPHDEFFNPKPKFYYFDDLGGIVCNISLPSNAPIYQIVGTPQSSKEVAKKEACLKAIEELHKLGALDEYLLSEQKNANEEELELESPDFDSYEGEDSRADLHEMLVPATLRDSWKESESPICLNSYYIHFIPDPPDRIYKEFGLFVKSPLPGEAEKMELDLHLARGRSVMTKLVPSGVMEFTKDEVMQAQNFQEMSFRAILDRLDFISELVPLGKDDYRELRSSTYYLLLPVKFHKHANTVTVDWKLVRRCLSSPIFRNLGSSVDRKKFPSHMLLQLDNGCSSINDVENSLVYVPHQNLFYFVTNIVCEKNSHCRYKDLEATSYVDHLSEKYDIHLKYPEQPLLRAKPVFRLHNLLHNRKHEDSESHELDEYFCDLPPEICQLKIIGFSKDIGSSLSLLPSIMHRLENLLVAIELKHVLSASFPEGAEVTADRVLEALTTEKCQERFSLERLEILGDAFLKYAVGRHFFLLHDTLDEGELTRKRSNAVNNSNLFKLAIRSNVQVFIRDQPFDPCQFFALGRRCSVICSKGTKGSIHSQCTTDASEVRCSKGHHWLQRKTIADVVEALVGAFIVDSGFKAATAFLRWIGIPVDFEVSQVTNVCMASKSYLPLAVFRDMVALENLLDYQFLHRGLLLQAFVHPSYTEHGGGCYQRLEFLGDAVLDYLIISYLFSVYPNLKPGHLTDLRSILANNKAIANVAVDRSFHKFIFFDSGGLKEAINNYVNFMNSSSVRESSEGPKCPKALGDLVESCLGAILLDTGFNLETVWKVMLSFLDPIMSFSSFQLSPLRELQELCQCHGLNLQFPTLKTGGKYLVEAKVMKDNDVCLSVSVTNLSKKDAVRIASELLFPRLKAEGYIPKSKPLKDVLKSSDKKEARLIGYDETPVDFVVPDSTEFGKLKVAEPSSSNSSDSDSEATSSNSSPPVNRRSSFPFKDIIGQSRKNIADPSDIESQTSGDSQNKSARSRLYEICAANCWKPPLFECCEEEGPSHLRLFTFRAILEIESSQDIVLECFGTPQAKKKAAAEQAAEAALWYLEHEGYLQ